MSETVPKGAPPAWTAPAAWQDPLLAFAIGAALLFAVAAWTVPAPPVEPAPLSDEGAPPVSEPPIEAMAAAFEARAGRPPDRSERASLTRRWLDDALLYREGRRLGLHEGDPVIRARVVEAMLAEALEAESPTPSRAELERFFRDHPERYREPPRLDFSQVFVGRREFPDPEVSAKALLAELEAGADPRALPGRFSAGKRFTPGRVAGTYGTTVASALETLAPGKWAAITVDSGVHLVRIEARDPGGELPPFEGVRSRVARDMADWERAQRRQKEVDALRPYFRVVRVDD